MCADDASHERFEERMRSIAEQLGRSVERLVTDLDLEPLRLSSDRVCDVPAMSLATHISGLPHLS